MKKLKKLIAAVVFIFAFFATIAVPVSAKGGFNEFGYNYTARNFVGTGGGWCAAKGFDWNCSGYAPMISYANDRLVMKWNAEWDRGNDEGWSKPPYDAWENNEWNGAVSGGSGEVWHYKIVWVGSELGNSPYWREGGYPVWGQFEVMMDQGTSGGEHVWFTKSIPNGYGL